jgi:Raf kinase inhibitor-like YbhB/YbcL family protein
MQWHHLGAAALGIGLAACSGSATQEASSMTSTMRLVSSAFGEGGAIPSVHTCDGEDTSPPLAWQDVPESAGAFAVIVTDPDAGGFVHWLLTDIPAGTSELAAGAGDAVGVPGPNTFGGSGWAGPCPPSGEHRYVFTVYALSEPLGIGSRADAGQVRAAMQGRILGQGQLTGVYRRR